MEIHKQPGTVGEESSQLETVRDADSPGSYGDGDGVGERDANETW